ncbi:MAG: hypothetical protein AVDCRST_MAG78-3672, partial [uncultured Rubrobacteraceae bacterium]
YRLVRRIPARVRADGGYRASHRGKIAL